MSILKLLSHKSWGSDRICLLRLYNALIRSQLDYACFVYASARKSTLRILNPIHHLGLRLCTGAFRTSPIQSLYAESNQWPLEKRRTFLGASYVLRTSAVPNHPCYNLLTGPQHERLFNNKPRVIPPLSIRNKHNTGRLTLEEPNTEILPFDMQCSPWELEKPKCNFTLLKYNKTTTPKQIIIDEFRKIENKYSSHAHFFTDGSKGDGYVGFGVFSPKFIACQRLDQTASVFTAELYGIFYALNHIVENNIEKSVIFSDSQSALQSLRSLGQVKNSLVQKLHITLTACINQGLDVEFCWVPSHIGIEGNEKADNIAAGAKELRCANAQLPFQDYRNQIKRAIFKDWQNEWSTQTNNKLAIIKPTLCEWSSCRHNQRYYEVILCRLRIGHTRLTHNYLLSGQQPPTCNACSERLTVLHILITCPEYEHYRRQHFTLFYKYKIPFHPALLLNDCPLVEHKKYSVS